MMENGNTVLTEYSVWRFLTRDGCGASYFVRHVFCFLREHPELLKSEYYKRLYDETLDYQIEEAVERAGWKRNERKRNVSWIEHIADINNNDETFEKYSRETVDGFLEYRREIWQNARYMK